MSEGLIVAHLPHGHVVRDRRRMASRPQSDLNPHPVDAPKDFILTEESEAGRTPTRTIDVAIRPASSRRAAFDRPGHNDPEGDDK